MKRRPVDTWFWELFVSACGSRCCVCGAAGVNLERGHIIPHGVGAPDGIENLIPVCAPCNKRYLKTETPDNRPVGWRESFFLRLGHELRPQISVSHAKGLCSIIPSSEPAENKTVISWKNADFGSPTGVFTQSCSMTNQRAKILVQNLVTRSQSSAAAPRVPSKSRVVEMLGLALKHGAETFWNVGLEFLRRTEGKGIDFDPWQPFTEHFYLYQNLAIETAEREKQAKERRAAEEKEQRECEQQRRRDIFLSVKNVPSWPGMSEADTLFISGVHELSAPPEAVSNADFERAEDIKRRWQAHEVNDAKAKLFSLLKEIPESWRDGGHEEEYARVYYAVKRVETKEQVKLAAQAVLKLQMKAGGQ